jgi:hypothetical protein
VKLHGGSLACMVAPVVEVEGTIRRGSTQHQEPKCAERAGWGYARAGRGKHVARAHGVNVSTGTRYRQGVAYSPLAKALAVLAAADKTTAWPLLTEARILVARAELETLPTPALIQRRADLEYAEISLNAEVQHGRLAGGTMRGQRARQLDMVQELAAIEDVLLERGEGAQ